MKILCIRLNSGEEIIGRADDDAPVIINGTNTPTFEGLGPWEPVGSVTLNTIRGITFQPVGKNQIGIAFVPFLCGNTDGAATFKLENCAQTIYAPSRDIEDGYRQQTSGIELARPGIQV